MNRKRSKNQKGKMNKYQTMNYFLYGTIQKAISRTKITNQNLKAKKSEKKKTFQIEKKETSKNIEE